MRMRLKSLAVLCALSIAVTGLSGCVKNPANDSSDGSANTNSTGIGSLFGQNADQTSENNSTQTPEYPRPASSDCTITFSGDSVSVDGGGAAANGSTVTVSKAGVYTITGSSDNGKILINAGDKDEVTLLLNGVKLTSKSGSVIDCEKAKLLALYVEDNTENSLSDSENYTFKTTDTEPDAAVFSRADMIIAGGGSLTVNGLYNNAVKCKDGISVCGGSLEINSVDDGIVGKDNVIIQSGKIKIAANGDGIKSTNDTDADRGYITVNGGTIEINSEKDGIQAETALTVNGGTIKIISGGEDAYAEIKASGSPFDRDFRFPGAGGSTTTASSESQKGLKAGADILINGGELEITSADDSVHSNANVTVSDGTLLLSSCDDGIHADETLTVKGGKITVTKSYEGLEGKNIEISGGEISVVAEDDGINAAGGDNGSYFGFDSSSNDYYIKISGGNIIVNANGDGIDSNGTIAQSGGVLTIYGPTNSGNGAIDYEKSYAVSGGTLIALGSSGMAQAPSTLSQPCLSIYANVAANSRIEVRDQSGNVILSTTTPKACQSLIFSSDKLKSGSDYGIYANDKLLSTVTAGDGVTGGGASGSGFGGGFGNQGGFGGRPGGFGGTGGQTPPGGIGGGQTPPDGFGGGRADKFGSREFPNESM